MLCKLSLALSGVLVILPCGVSALSSPCGSIAKPDPLTRGPARWQLCHLRLADDKQHENTSCQDLIRDVQPHGMDTVYRDATELERAGGRFSCLATDSEQESSDINKACSKRNLRRDRLQGRNVLRVCMRLPFKLPASETGPTKTLSGPCGSRARPDPLARGPNRWQLCYIREPEDAEYAMTSCKDLIRNLQPHGNDVIYANSSALTSAGGRFGCWASSEGLRGDIARSCSHSAAQEVTLSGSTVLGLCIRFPKTYLGAKKSLLATQTKGPRVGQQPGSVAGSSSGSVSWRTIGPILAGVLVLVLVAVALVLTCRCPTRRGSLENPEPEVILDLLRKRRSKTKDIYAQQMNGGTELDLKKLRRLPSLPVGERIYEEIPGPPSPYEDLPDTPSLYESPVPHCQSMTSSAEIYMDMDKKKQLLREHHHDNTVQPPVSKDPLDSPDVQASLEKSPDVIYGNVNNEVYLSLPPAPHLSHLV